LALFGSVAASILVGALVACGGGGGSSNSTAPLPNPNPNPAPVTLSFAVVASGFSAPLGIAHAGDGSGRLFVVEQGGRIIIFRNGAKLATPFLDIGSKVVAGGERGLLGLAFPPNFAAKKHFYVNYTRTGDGATVVARYRVSASNADIADAATEQILLTVAQPFSNHNGGHLAFGPDGMLYIGTGDGGAGGDPDERAQNSSELLGKMLRIDVESGAPPYAIPAGNAFPGGVGGRAEIWALGLRNPWRYAFDRQSGDLYIGDVGQGTDEEISFLAAGSAAGSNFGWDVLEGNDCFEPSSNCSAPANYVAPVATYTRGGSCASVTGGQVYRGPGNAALQGVYLYADFCDGRIWGLRRSAGAWQNDLLADTDFSISSFGEDEAGNVYFVDLNSGELRRIDAD
jgi:glucose/arabinose dehydrogenase